MQSTDKEHIALLADLCVQNNLKHIVLSPGSRNAPLITAFESHPEITTYLIHDERVAAFTALGLADSLGEAVGITCTSGTALLNYSPAIAEAYYRQIPLVVFSADRPGELIDQGDGQTMRQNGVYANFIKKSFDFPNHDSKNIIEDSRKTLQSLIQNIKEYPQGPLHLNIPLAEPLYGMKEYSGFENFQLDEITDALLSDVDKEKVKSEWDSAEKKLVIVGQSKLDKALEQQIVNLSEDPSVAILVENTSNIQHFPRLIHSIDRTLEAIGSDELDKFSPDLILSIGGAIISKRIKTFLRNADTKISWRVGEFLLREDTYQSSPTHYSVTPRHFLSVLNEGDYLPLSNYGGAWKQKDLMANEVHNSFLPSAPYSDLKVFEIVLDSIPEAANLHMANSSVVRYCQLFNPVRSTKYFANRGVSGIDGSTSAAAGFSIASPSDLNVLITGDTSFFYDSNAFWNQHLSDNLRVIVIRNGGGGIFEIIDGPKNSKYSETFFAPFNASVKGICEAFDVGYLSASSETELTNSFQELFSINENGRPVLLEINTTDCSNDLVLKAYFESISELQNT
ncbi:MAG: 2-succinyl-5-enolpyruvyl-6-hydroxy-3-cyclohexene-1-carboxylate synthase [Arenicella sp.]|jgi:2-succinyl-5-enolpyruvyl-6-hydroxy-3-cyclohexene-1-carboxylate synthase